MITLIVNALVKLVQILRCISSAHSLQAEERFEFGTVNVCLVDETHVNVRNR
jgi:hypothetical protein